MSSISQTHEKPDFAAVYDANYDRVFKYAYTLLMNREDAEDVTADAFVAAYLDFDRYDPQKAAPAAVARPELDHGGLRCLGGAWQHVLGQ